MTKFDIALPAAVCAFTTASRAVAKAVRVTSHPSFAMDLILSQLLEKLSATRSFKDFSPLPFSCPIFSNARSYSFLTFLASYFEALSLVNGITKTAYVTASNEPMSFRYLIFVSLSKSSAFSKASFLANARYAVKPLMNTGLKR